MLFNLVRPTILSNLISIPGAQIFYSTAQLVWMLTKGLSTLFSVCVTRLNQKTDAELQRQNILVFLFFKSTKWHFSSKRFAPCIFILKVILPTIISRHGMTMTGEQPLLFSHTSSHPLPSTDLTVKAFSPRLLPYKPSRLSRIPSRLCQSRAGV
jgi:hypothetical protein